MPWGIGGKRHQKRSSAIASAMGRPPPAAKASLIVVRRGSRRRLRHPAQLTLEDGAVLAIDKALPGDLPAGYHTLRYLDEDRDTKLIVSPGVCYLPERLAHLGLVGPALCAAILGQLGDRRFR